MEECKKDFPERYLRLEHILQRTYFDYADAYKGGTNKERQRNKIAQELEVEISYVKPSRLLTLLNQAMKWNEHMGMLPQEKKKKKGDKDNNDHFKYDIFQGKTPDEVEEVDEIVTKNSKIIKFGKSSYPEVACFSPNGKYLASGSVDGFVEIWDYESGKLNKELKYQEQDDCMMHDESVLSIAFSRDSQLLASGDAKGNIKIWRIQTGSCIRKFINAHSEGISALCFARDGTQVMSSSYDNLVRVHGLKSGRVLKEFRGHSSFVNDALYSYDGSKIVSCSSDGTVKVWDSKTTACLQSFTPNKPKASASSNATGSVTQLQLTLLPRSTNEMFSVARGSQISLINTSGQTMREYKVPSGEVVSVTASAKGKYVYILSEDKVLYCFDVETSTIQHMVKTHKKQVVGVAHHPHRNIMATYARDGSLKIWKP